MVLEHQLHRLKIEFRGQIEHGEIFVVEGLGGRGFFQLAVGEVFVKLAMRLYVALHVHTHEGGELHEAGINPAAAAGIARRHGGDQLLLEPVHRLALGKLVDLGRIDAGVDRAGHQRHRARLRRVVALRHHARRDQRADARLAHGDHMRAGSDLLQEADQVRSVIVEAERPIAERDIAGIVPVGNVDVMFGEHGAHGGAQQCREMSRQRRDQQHARLRLVDVLLEMPQRRERRDVESFFGDRDFAVSDHDAVDAVSRPRMGQPGARDQFVSRRQIAQR